MSTLDSIAKSFVWRFMERFGAQVITIIVFVLLGRILEPEVFGLLSLITAFTAILDVFVDGGIPTALVQKEGADEIDYSSVFYFNILFSLLLYALLFIVAPYVAAYYSNDGLTLIIRVVGISLIVSGFKTVQIAYISKNFLFSKLFTANIISSLLSGVAAVILALWGYGVWALVAQSIVSQSCSMIVLWIIVPWRPRWLFSIRRLGTLINYSWKVLATNLLSTGYDKLSQLIIGKKYSPEDLAFYIQGQYIPYSLISSINVSLDSVLLPGFSKEQSNKESIKELSRLSIRVCSFIIVPMMIGAAAVSDGLIVLLLKEKWLPASPYFRIACFSFAFYPVASVNSNIMKALGRSDMLLKVETIKKVLGVGAIVLSMSYGVKAIAYALLAANLLGVTISMWAGNKMVGYRLKSQFQDVLPSLLISAVMGVSVMLASSLGISSNILVVIQILFGIILYCLLSYICNRRDLNLLIEIVKKLVNYTKG